MEVRGLVLLRVSDAQYGKIRLSVENNDDKGFQMQVLLFTLWLSGSHLLLLFSSFHSQVSLVILLAVCYRIISSENMALSSRLKYFSKCHLAVSNRKIFV